MRDPPTAETQANGLRRKQARNAKIYTLVLADLGPRFVVLIDCASIAVMGWLRATGYGRHKKSKTILIKRRGSRSARTRNLANIKVPT